MNVADQPALYRWSEVEVDNPIPLLSRRKVLGDKTLVARVNLAKGCLVATHTHDSEQVAVVLSGKVRWFVGPEGDTRDLVMQEGEVLVIPSNSPHGIEALEDAEIIDILSPPGLMGIDHQGAGAH